MPLKRGTDGLLYGRAIVILSKEVDGEFVNIIGSVPPFGGIGVSEEYEGKCFREEPYEWWRRQGFLISEAPELEVARQEYRDRSKAEQKAAANG